MEYVIKATNGELYHHGIKGQKWGVRRFQNKNGSLTSAGKKHYGIEIPERKERPEIVKRAADSGINSNVNRANRERRNNMLKNTTAVNARNERPDNHPDYNKAHDRSKSINSMSNAELKEINKRLNMEQEYRRLSRNDIKTGKDYLNTVIKAGTTVAAVTSTGLTIYNNYEKIMKILKKS